LEAIWSESCGVAWAGRRRRLRRPDPELQEVRQVAELRVLKYRPVGLLGGDNAEHAHHVAVLQGGEKTDLAQGRLAGSAIVIIVNPDGHQRTRCTHLLGVVNFTQSNLKINVTFKI